MKYHETHPWLKFSLSLPLDRYRLWLRLGEISSKVEHLAGVPLRPDIALELHKIYLTKGILATTAIEGNTLSEEQVRLAVEGTLNLPKSQQYLHTEVQNILDVCNREAEALIGGGDVARRTLTVELIRDYNRNVLRNLELQEDVVPGELRRHSVVVGNVYRGAPAEDCACLLQRLCDWLNGEDFTPPDEELRIPFALVKAVVAHLYLAWIHPFGDGNGRTARLVEFHILLASGVPLPAAHLLSDHYNLTRTKYYRELARASASGGELVPFIEYALQGFLDGIRAQIGTVRVQQMAVTWKNFVHECFRKEKASPAQRRRRDLVLDLSGREWIDVAQIPLLTPRLARDYAEAGDRMVQRDLNALHQMKLIERRHGEVRASIHTIQAFLPGRVG